MQTQFWSHPAIPPVRPCPFSSCAIPVDLTPEIFQPSSFDHLPIHCSRRPIRHPTATATLPLHISWSYVMLFCWFLERRKEHLIYSDFSMNRPTRQCHQGLMGRRLMKNHLLQRGDVRQQQLDHAVFANNSLHMRVSKLRPSTVSNEIIWLRFQVDNARRPRATYQSQHWLGPHPVHNRTCVYKDFFWDACGSTQWSKRKFALEIRQV